MTTVDDLALLSGKARNDVFDEANAETVPALEMDEDLYMEDLSDLDITDAQKQELLEILWSIMSSMVAMGFSHDVCGQIFGDEEDFPAISYGAVESVSPLKAE